MRIRIGPIEHRLVYRIFPRRISTPTVDGHYHEVGWQRGNLVMSTGWGLRKYHRVEEMMCFRFEMPESQPMRSGK